MFDRIKKFFAESRQELRHVNWPTREEAIRLTTIVIGIALGLALFLGFFDWLFTNIIKNFIIKA
jgi:preprotein translocase subunit SecE